LLSCKSTHTEQFGSTTPGKKNTIATHHKKAEEPFHEAEEPGTAAKNLKESGAFRLVGVTASSF